MKFSYILLLCIFFVTLVVVPTFAQESNEEIEVDAQQADGNLEEEIVEDVQEEEIIEETDQEEAAEEEEEEEEEKEPELLPSPDVETAFVFPGYPTQEFHAGEPAEVVLGVTNTGVRALHFTSIKGTLYYHLDSKYVIENYTNPEIDVSVNPNEQRSIGHRFRPHPMLDIGQFGIVFTAYYHDNDGGNFSSVFFNQTIDIVEKEDNFDTDMLFRSSFVIALVLLGLFVAWRATKSLGNKRQSAAIERGTITSSADNHDWLANTSADNFGGKKNK